MSPVNVPFRLLSLPQLLLDDKTSTIRIPYISILSNLLLNRQAGLACAFSSSFAHVLVIGRPGLAIAYAMRVDPDTGERLLRVGDLIKYGLALVVV
ncbi:hypothetical protein ACFLXO_02050, partial [Chloroflexota bacterium]